MDGLWLVLSQFLELSHLHNSSRGWFLSFPLYGPRLRMGPQTISTQGDLVSRRADPPSQDRRSLGYLVSSPQLATDPESRRHQLAGDVALQPQSGEGQRVDG